MGFYERSYYGNHFSRKYYYEYCSKSISPTRDTHKVWLCKRMMICVNDGLISIFKSSLSTPQVYQIWTTDVRVYWETQSSIVIYNPKDIDSEDIVWHSHLDHWNECPWDNLEDKLEYLRQYSEWSIQQSNSCNVNSLWYNFHNH